ncbi:hypothetical protein [Herbiconiux flava]|uniref:Uncharacterized protein n=1 Tax=Herbiconiux flava TaxID=881268 RepID=A0A852SK25_9MICO|nr:hypothetical protein [Herbiconiux flava]NYD69940.1 hypothetical protein [Herbiconiux flava]GLK16689.1 hypothetical protein GCM10017602_11710 [Herbiconiux flava]
MTKHTSQDRTAENDAAIEDLLWEFDVTRERADLDRATAPAPAPAPAGPTAVPRRPVAAKGGSFARPELRTRWQRFRGNLAVRILGWVLLVGGTATLVALAITQR